MFAESIISTFQRRFLTETLKAQNMFLLWFHNEKHRTAKNALRWRDSLFLGFINRWKRQSKHTDKIWKVETELSAVTHISAYLFSGNFV